MSVFLISATAGLGSLFSRNDRPSSRRAGRAQLAARSSRSRAARPCSRAARTGTCPPSPRSGPGRPKSVTQLEPHVVDHAERQRRRLDDHRPLGDVQVDPEIDGVRIGGQEQRLRIHQLREDEGRVVRDAGILEALEDGRHRSALVGVHERLDAVHQVEVVVGLRHGLLARRAVLVFQRADAASRPCRAW